MADTLNTVIQDESNIVAELGALLVDINKIELSKDGDTLTLSTTRDGVTKTLSWHNGVDGKDGKDGADGEKGETGEQGPQGEKGDKGDTGLTGPVGATGPQGEKGEKGDKGDKGETGEQGPAGADGKDGTDGWNGQDGKDGEDGKDGTPVISDTAPEDTERLWVDTSDIPDDDIYVRFDAEQSLTDEQKDIAKNNIGFDGDIQATVDDWLDRHPEATTSVEDHSLTYQKFVNGTLNFVTPEMFGAAGNGSDDDSDALSSALNSGYPVVFKGSATYAVSKSISGTAAFIEGNGAAVKLLDTVDTLFMLNSLEYIGNLTFNCADKGVRFCLYSKALKPVLKSITIHNIYDTRTDTGSIGIGLYGCDSILMDGISAYSCYHVGNGTIGDEAGNLSVIYVNDWVQNCTIRNCSFTDIHNVNDSGDIILEDSNSIYARSTLDTSVLIVDGVYFSNGGKRVIKTQCLKAEISHVNGYFDSADNLSVIGIGSLEDGSGNVAVVSISHCNIKGNHQSSGYHVFTSSEKTMITDCVVDCNEEQKKGSQEYSVYNTGSMTISNCRFNSIILNNGTDIKIADSDVAGIISTSYSNLESTVIANCTSSGSVSLYGASAMITDCILCGTGILSYADSTVVENCSILNGGVDAVYISQGTAMIKGLTAQASAANTARCVNINSGAVLYIDDFKTTSYVYSIVGRGTLHMANGVDLNLVFGGSADSKDPTKYNGFDVYSNEPPYLDVLPSKVGTMPSGTLCLLKTDGKLYKSDRVAQTWNAVN